MQRDLSSKDLEDREQWDVVPSLEVGSWAGFRRLDKSQPSLHRRRKDGGHRPGSPSVWGHSALAF